MNWLRDLLGRGRPSLAPDQVAALRAWSGLPTPNPHQSLGDIRWLVLDVESSGLDARRDRLISIGAVSVCGASLHLSDSIEVVLRQDQVSQTDNILVHGIGGTAQREGVAPVEALLRFLAYAEKSPIVAFHAPFDTVMIGRALRHYLGLKWKPQVIDLADVLPALLPAVKGRRDLDQWLAHFGIGHYARHQALSDAYSTAQLLQVALALAGQMTFAGLDGLQRDQRALLRLESVR